MINCYVKGDTVSSNFTVLYYILKFYKLNVERSII